MNHTRTNLILIATVFMIILFGPTIKSLVNPGHNKPVLEKRRLKNKPDVPQSFNDLIKYPVAFEKYHKDNFEFRYNWLDIYKHGKYLMNDPASNKVIFGTKPGWLFFNDKQQNDVIGDYRNINQFTEESVGTFVQNIKLKHDWLKSRGIEYLFVITPSKHYIYPEYLPKKYQAIAQDNMKTQLSKALSQFPEVKYLDLTNTILEGKSAHQMFLKNDTHWTEYAANLAQFEIFKMLSIIFPGTLTPQLKPWSKFINVQEHIGDLAQTNGTIALFPDLSVSPDYKVCANKLMPPKINNMDTFDTDCQQKLKALVFRDSFFKNLQPFVSEHLGRTRFVWGHVTFKEAETHINQIQPDLVIEQWVDRLLPTQRPPK